MNQVMHFIKMLNKSSSYSWLSSHKQQRNNNIGNGERKFQRSRIQDKHLSHHYSIITF